MIRLLCLGVLLAASLLVLPMQSQAQTDIQSARSVVQIRCHAAHGVIKATGFVWPEPGLVVTALHAVAGCGNGKGSVYSEAAKRETDIARIVAVDLEGDLALLSLEEDLGLKPVPVLSEAPDTRGRHVVWGYPLSAEQLIDLRIEFAGGLDGGTSTLGRAFSSSDLNMLFRNQEYPTRNTQILRVTTTIQPGHSGAPIFDEEGRLVAVADGGLLGGWRGINWSIPAHVYLPGLPQSDDPVPGSVSQQAELFSTYAVVEKKSVALGIDRATPQEGEENDTLVEVGRVPLPLVLDVFDVENDKDLSWIRDDLAEIVPQPAEWAAFRFAAFQTLRGGDLYFTPERATTEFDEATGFLDSTSIDGAVRQISFSYRGDTFEEALKTGSAAFFERLSQVGVPGVPLAVPEADVDRQLEYVDYDDTVGEEERVEFVVQMNGPLFSGRVLHLAQTEDDMSDADYVDYMMMDLATYDLNSLWPLDEEIDAVLDRTAAAGAGGLPGQSVLTLVRRVPLKDVARDFVAMRDFEWKSDMSYLKSRLKDPADLDTLTFDVYEDRATGATIAIPSGLELNWNPELGAVVAEYASGKIQLAIAIQRAVSFRAAAGAGLQDFVTHLSEIAEWDERRPTDCDIAYFTDDREAECWDEFSGTDRKTGESADLYLALSVRDTDFLGTSVYIVGDEDVLSDGAAVNYLMMLIGAEHLSDFAVK